MSLGAGQAVLVNGSKAMKGHSFLPIQRRVGLRGFIYDGRNEAVVYRAAGTLGDRAVAASESRSLSRLDRGMPDSGMVPLWVTLK